MESIESREENEGVFEGMLSYITEKRDAILGKTANNEEWVNEIKEHKDIKPSLLAYSMNSIKESMGLGGKKEEQKYPTIKDADARQYTIGKQFASMLGIDTLKEEWKELTEQYKIISDFFDTGKNKK